MLSMVVTAAVFQESSGWLKAFAELNIPFMVVTAEVSQEPSGWLKALAPENICAMSTTAEVFHARMSSLNHKLFANNLVMLVTSDTSQLSTRPYVEVNRVLASAERNHMCQHLLM